MKKILAALLVSALCLCAAGSPAQQSNSTWYPARGMPYIDVRGWGPTYNGPIKTGVPNQSIELVFVDWESVPSYMAIIIGPYQDRFTQAFPFGVLHINLAEAHIWGTWLNPQSAPGAHSISLTDYMGIGYIDHSLRGLQISIQAYFVYGITNGIDAVPDPWQVWLRRPGQSRWLTYARVITLE